MLTNEELYNLQVEYCKANKLPLFCHKTTGKGTPIGEYLIKSVGYEKTISKLSTELITSCPETGRTWCD